VSVFTNHFRNNKAFRAIFLLVVGSAIGATSYPFLAPVVLPLLDSMICNGAPGCSGLPIPDPVVIPPKPEEPKLCVVVNGVEICK
jgi:hypothetical protein